MLCSSSNEMTGAVIVVLVLVFALGLNVKDATWMNGKIAEATAGQINLATDIERKKAALELETLKTQTEIQIEQQKQLAAIVAARQRQALEAENTANLQRAEFRSALYTTISYGIMAVFFAASIALTAIGISAGLGLNRILTARARTVPVRQNTPGPVIHQFPSHSFSKNGRSENLARSKYPEAN